MHARKLLVVTALVSVAPLSAERHAGALTDFHGHSAIEECPYARAAANDAVMASADASPIESAYLAGHYVRPLLP